MQNYQTKQVPIEQMYSGKNLYVVSFGMSDVVATPQRNTK